MVKKSLNQYKGGLSPEQIAEGMNAARRNAARLVDDAGLLLESKRFPSAAALAILAVEEAGKLPILRLMSVVQDNPKVLKEHWRDYRKHTKKNVGWLFPQLYAQGARRLEDFFTLFDEESDHPFVLDHWKQLGFYTDCLGDVVWSSPPEVVEEGLARELVRNARTLTNLSEVTPLEIELWIKHMRPYMKSGTVLDYAGTKRALRDWHADMQKYGLTAHSAESIEAFLGDPSDNG
jgi:AbiV family abortive infection protein